jgi:hypothetical protein
LGATFDAGDFATDPFAVVEEVVLAGDGLEILAGDFGAGAGVALIAAGAGTFLGVGLEGNLAFSLIGGLAAISFLTGTGAGFLTGTTATFAAGLVEGLGAGLGVGFGLVTLAAGLAADFTTAAGLAGVFCGAEETFFDGTTGLAVGVFTRGVSFFGVM